MIAIATLVLTILFGLVSPGMAGELCLLPSAAMGLNMSVSCVSLGSSWNDWIGYRSGGGEPCQEISFLWLCVGGGFGWTLSSSATDPLHNVDPLPLGTAQLYLWYYCTMDADGLLAAEFDLGGTIAVHSFTPVNGFSNAGDATHLLLSVGGCPTGPVMAGIIQVHDPIAVDATTWGRIKGTYR
jgi:hypothetical protein